MRQEVFDALTIAEAAVRQELAPMEVAISNDRERYFFAVWRSVMETGVAVKVLHTHADYPPLYAASSTLLRPMLEKLARGAFIAWSATAEECATILDRIEDNRPWPVSFATLLERVAESGVDGGYLSKLDRDIGHALHSAVHGGLRHVQRFQGAGFFGQNVSDEELEEVVLLAAALALVAAAYTFGAGGNDASERLVAPHLERIFELANDLGGKQRQPN